MFDRHLTQPALAELADIPTRSRWVRSGGVRLHALDYGGDRPPLVILPGITSPTIALDFVARELTDLTRPVVLDVRGRGLSDGAGTGRERIRHCCGDSRRGLADALDGQCQPDLLVVLVREQQTKLHGTGLCRLDCVAQQIAQNAIEGLPPAAQ